METTTTGNAVVTGQQMTPVVAGFKRTQIRQGGAMGARQSIVHAQHPLFPQSSYVNRPYSTSHKTKQRMDDAGGGGGGEACDTAHNMLLLR